MRIDSHHHLWQYTSAEYGWIDDTMQALRRDFLPTDLAQVCAAARVDGTVAVQARQTPEETHWLLSLAAENPLIRGVVGWLDIAAKDFHAMLEPFLANPNLKGLRHVVQAEPAGFLDAPAFNRGVQALTPTGLVYDILIVARQLDEAIRFVDRHPRQSFVLDHIAKPPMRNQADTGAIDSWAKSIRDLARRPNVACKLSGMVTEADWHTWTPASLKPYCDVVLEAFGPDRLMAGSDWPVLNVASTYTQWWQTLDAWLAPLSPNDRAQIGGLTATHIYNL